MAVNPAPSTATTVTSVSPIISAAAVEAVRPGLRTALAPASSPATPPARFAGQPTMRASGLTSLGAVSAMPANSPSTPPPSNTATSTGLAPPAKMPAEIAAIEASTTPRPALCECAAIRVGGRVEPSRTAAIGGTRVARRAGRTLARSVMLVPSRSETTTVRVAITVEASGRSMPSALNSPVIPCEIPSPSTSPISEASRPITRASRTTERITCLREAPSVRSVANSRVRCATVMDSVLKITNAPTSSAMPPKPSRT